MTSAEILFTLAILIISAKIIGEITNRLGFYHIIGEIIAGLMLGPFLKIIQPNATINEIASIAMLFLFFIIGSSINHEANKREIKDSFPKTAIFISIVILSGLIYGYLSSNIVNGVIISIVIMASSTVLAKDTLNYIGQAKTQLYKSVLTITYNSKIISFLFLSFLFISVFHGLYASILSIVFIVLLGAISICIKPIIQNIDLEDKIKDEYVLLSAAIIFMFLTSYLFDKFTGVGAIGAFIAGFLLSNFRATQSNIMPKIKTITYGFFAPVLFTYMFAGVKFNLSWNIVFFMILVSMISRQIIFMFKENITKNSIVSGLTFSHIGELSIVVSYLALNLKIIDSTLFTSLIIFVIFNTIIVNLLVKFLSK